MDLTYSCAGCGELNDVALVRADGDRQQFVEDCAVCCRPMVITARWNEVAQTFDVDVYQEDRD